MHCMTTRAAQNLPMSLFTRMCTTCEDEDLYTLTKPLYLYLEIIWHSHAHICTIRLDFLCLCVLTSEWDVLYLEPHGKVEAERGSLKDPGGLRCRRHDIVIDLALRRCIMAMSTSTFIPETRRTRLEMDVEC